jgi:putative addiction module killer protein
MNYPIEITAYELSTGKCPFRQWLRELDVPIKSIVLKRLERIQNNNFGDCKRLQGSTLWELRIDTGPGYRIYFGKISNRIIILLTAGDKKTQVKDIKKAEEYWENYIKEEDGKNSKIS